MNYRPLRRHRPYARRIVMIRGREWRQYQHARNTYPLPPLAERIARAEELR